MKRGPTVRRQAAYRIIRRSHVAGEEPDSTGIHAAPVQQGRTPDANTLSNLLDCKFDGQLVILL